jgi:hypothetical protein
LGYDNAETMKCAVEIDAGIATVADVSVKQEVGGLALRQSGVMPSVVNDFVLQAANRS